MKLARSPWFPVALYKPAREGLYECNLCGRGSFHLWTNGRWYDKNGLLMIDRDFSWRGLAEKP